MVLSSVTANDRDYERVFVGDRQITMTHFHAISWPEDTNRPLVFAFGYWSHDAVYHQGFVRWNERLGEFGRPVFNLAR